MCCDVEDCEHWCARASAHCAASWIVSSNTFLQHARTDQRVLILGGGQLGMATHPHVVSAVGGIAWMRKRGTHKKCVKLIGRCIQHIVDLI
jgi:hypothetical protein